MLGKTQGVINLKGEWRFALDKQGIGEAEQFYNKVLEDTIMLPGTTDTNKKGDLNDRRELGYLTREYYYVGKAWYQRTITIPQEWDGKPVSLYLERTRVSKVWLDDDLIGTKDSLNTPHIHELALSVDAGEHRLTIMIDNENMPIKGGHLTSPDTQTNWNGITGAIELRAYETVHINTIRVFPNIAQKSAKLELNLESGLSTDCQCSLSVSAVGKCGDKEHICKEQRFSFNLPDGKSTLSFDFEIGEEMLLWDEYERGLYTLEAVLQTGKYCDTVTTTFGMRDFTADGTQFAINGRKTFLRGKHDGLVFPLTGHAPTEVEDWLRVLSIAKSYGINHYRFHTCCPPEAAFIAADMLGIYMQPELPFWGTITVEGDEGHNKEQSDYLFKEGFRILDAFGNHPSFVMFTLGNELWGSKEKMDSMNKAYKKHDPRHLYSQGSNNFQFTPVVLESDDFLCSIRTPLDNTNIRGSICQVDRPLGHIQTDAPNTMTDYTAKISSVSVPIVSHEIGQFQVFPNFDEIRKYTGVLKARNFEVFRERLEEKGLLDLAKDYFEASGQLSVALYREDIEATLRTDGFGGFQLLDLQDFPGQGTALVGMLDAFMESKGLITPEKWREFCSDAVLLARFPAYIYEEDSTFTADIDIAYYRPNPLLAQVLEWSIKQGGEYIAQGELSINDIKLSATSRLGTISAKLVAKAPARLTLELSLADTDIRTSYDLWVYPKSVDTSVPANVHLATEVNEAIRALESGKNVLLISNKLSDKHSIEGFYPTDFWCYPMFRTISESRNDEPAPGTMGLLCNNKHPALASFPSEFFSTPQWWSIVKASRAAILNDTPHDYRPIIQVMDNFERNHKMGMIFETRAGKDGKLLVCTSDLLSIQDKPEAKQLLHSLLQYVKDFKPEKELELSAIKQIFGTNI